jgi:hypothetical protein
LIVDTPLRGAWLRAEAQCECTKDAQGHGGQCPQVLVWDDRGGTGKGAWEVRHLNDPRVHPLQILCAACYAKLTGRVPKGSS